MEGEMLVEYGVYYLVLEWVSLCKLCMGTIFHWIMFWVYMQVHRLHLRLKARSDIATLGVLFVAKWCNIESSFATFT